MHPSVLSFFSFPLSLYLSIHICMCMCVHADLRNIGKLASTKLSQRPTATIRSSRDDTLLQPMVSQWCQSRPGVTVSRSEWGSRLDGPSSGLQQPTSSLCYRSNQPNYGGCGHQCARDRHRSGPSLCPNVSGIAKQHRLSQEELRRVFNRSKYIRYM